MSVRVAIVEDQQMIREYVGWICSTGMGYKIVGETDRGLEAEALVERTSPDLLILDLRMPDADGLEVAEQVRLAQPDLRILLMSGHCDEVTIQRIERSLVNGFIDKNFSQMTEFKQALKTVMAGQRFFSPSYHRAVQVRKMDPRSFDKLLTDREQHVVGFIACAMNDREIAERLRLRPSTVETHRRNILRKLDIDNTPKLIKYAIDHGFVNFLMRLRNPRRSADCLVALATLRAAADFVAAAYS